jgi:hypothetical protein
MNPRKVLCGLLLCVGCVVIPSASYAQATSDNPSVTGQLNDAKTRLRAEQNEAGQFGSTVGLIGKIILRFPVQTQITGETGLPWV